MRVAVIGCAHGEVGALYQAIEEYESRSGHAVDVVVCCGDFQACRNLADLHTMACPAKYKSLNTFHDFYFGRREASRLMIFVGGNHEASNHLQELPYGGWVAPNIFYLGHSGCIRVGGDLVVAGLSGIYKRHDYWKGRYERLPYDRASIRTVFHVKQLDVSRLLMLPPGKKVDVFLSHDWPTRAACRDNSQSPQVHRLLKRKPFFRDEVMKNELGSPVNNAVLDHLAPSHWFSAHLHVRFATDLPSCGSPHPKAMSMPEKDPNELDLDEEEEEGTIEPNVNATPPIEGTNKKTRHDDAPTRFLALDKILPGREFLEVIDVEGGSGSDLYYDRDWLTIVKATHQLTPLGDKPSRALNEFAHANLDEARAFVDAAFPSEESLLVPRNFTATVSASETEVPNTPRGNPQTDAFFQMLALDHLPFTVPCKPPPL